MFLSSSTSQGCCFFLLAINEQFTIDNMKTSNKPKPYGSMEQTTFFYRPKEWSETLVRAGSSEVLRRSPARSEPSLSTNDNLLRYESTSK